MNDVGRAAMREYNISNGLVTLPKRRAPALPSPSASASAHDTTPTLPNGLLAGITLPIVAVTRGGYVWDETARANVWDDEAWTVTF